MITQNHCPANDDYSLFILFPMECAFRSDTVKQGWEEQHIPPHAAVITLGFPFLSYEPITKTGAG
jgi:hypothetical protein